MSRDKDIADEVYRAMSGLKVCSQCNKEFEPTNEGDTMCRPCVPLGMASAIIAAQAMAHAAWMATIPAIQAAKAFNELSKAFSKLKISKED